MKNQSLTYDELLIRNKELIQQIEEIKKHTDKFRTTLNSIGDAVIATDKFGKITGMNPVAESLCGWKENEALGQELSSVFRIINSFTRNIVENPANKVLQTGEIVGLANHTVLMSKDGKEYQIADSGAPIRDDQGNINGVVLVFRDVTEEYQIRDALGQSEKKFRTYVEYTPNGIIRLNEKSVITDVNIAAEKITGYQANELVSTNFSNLCPEGERDLFEKFWTTVRKEGSSYTDMCIIGNNGTKRCLTTHAVKLTETNYLVFITDISERKKAEQELISEREFSEKIIETSLAIIVGLDKNHIIRLFNRGAENITGYKKSEVIGKDWFKIFFPAEMLAEMNRVWKDAWGITSHSYQNPIIKKGGEQRIISWQTSGFYEDSDTSKHLLISIGEDITEKELAKEDLKGSEEKFRTLTGNLNVGVYRNTPGGQGKFIEVNQAFLNIFGYKEKEEVLNLNVSDLYSNPDDRNQTNKEIQKAGFVKGKEILLKKSDGTQIFCAISTVAVKENKKIKYYDGIIEDITLRKQSEKALQESEERYHLLSEATFESIFISEKGICIGQNKTAENMFGYTSKEAIGRPGTEWIVPEDRDTVMQNMIAGYEMPYEVGALRKDGSTFPCEIQGRMLKFKNKLIRITALRDISDRRQVQKDLIQKNKELIEAKEKAEESDRLKSAFLANMSHEIRTPMNGILGFADLLKEQHLSIEEQQKYISIIEKSGERMLSTINDLIDISKIESGQMELTESEMSLKDLFDYLISFFKPEAEKKGIILTAYMQHNFRNIEIISDKDKVIAVLTNFIKNAIKYTFRGTIELGFNITIEGKNPMVEFSVSDTGIGIPKERHKAIFERFVQADIEDKDVYEGSGLGLSISKAYAEMLGGKSWVKSEVGKGSKFYFSLPYKSTEKVSPEKPTLKSKPDHQPGDFDLKVLIAEDEEFAIMHLTIILEHLGSKVLYARNGYETIEVCKTNPDIDLILMDIRMPGLNGYEATQKIRDFNKDVIIIAQTAYALTGDRDKAIKAGCNDYISKPIKKNKLIELIEKYTHQ